MGAEHDHAHEHVHQDRSETGLRWAFALNLIFVIIELFGGLYTNSVAILSDALHDLGDVLILGAAWYLQKLSARGANDRYSYGYGRYSMLGGWMGSIVLMIGAAWILVSAVPRFWDPEPVMAEGMVLLAILGVVANGWAARMLKGGASLNERAAFLHLLEDVLGWAAVLVGGLVIWVWGLLWIDPLMSIAIGVYILYNAIRAFRKGTRILMQARPPAVDQDQVRELLLALPGVLDVHDQHIWSLDGAYTILTAHIVVADDDRNAHRQLKVKARDLLKDLGIAHATLELEQAGEHCGTAWDQGPVTA